MFRRLEELGDESNHKGVLENNAKSPEILSIAFSTQLLIYASFLFQNIIKINEKKANKKLNIRQLIHLCCQDKKYFAGKIINYFFKYEIYHHWKYLLFKKINNKFKKIFSLNNIS